VPANVRAAGGWGITGAVVALATTIAIAQTPPAFKARVDVVVVEATVLDRDGAVVTDLTPADFAVEIAGSRREVVSADFVRHVDASGGAESIVADRDITTNTAASAGRTIVIAVDHVSLRTESRDVLQTAKAWVGTLGPSDRVGLMALPQPGVNIELSTDHARVMQALDTIVAHPNPPPPFSNRNISPWEAVRMWEGDEFVWSEVLKRECKGGDPSCPDEIKMQVKSRQLDMESTVIPVVRSLRSLAQGLFRYELGSHSLADALQDLATAADSNFRVQCTVQADRSIVLADRTADLHVYRISQEAITNAVKHGNAKKINLELRREGSRIVFQIRDDGAGASLEALASGRNGIGLRTMEFRARRLGGRFSIESHPGKGTSITCILPDSSASPQPECDDQKQMVLIIP